METSKLLRYAGFLSLCLAIGLPSFAQQRNGFLIHSSGSVHLFQRENRNAPGHHRFKVPLTQPSVNQQKPTQMQSRLKSLVEYEFDSLNMDYVPDGDSLELYWSGTRHQDNLAEVYLMETLVYPGYSQSFDLPAFILTSDSTHSFFWDNNSSSYLPDERAISTFDANGNITSSLELDYDTSSNIWENSYKSIYTYDANNNLTEELDQSWESGVWVNDWKYNYTYDANHNMTDEIDMSWDNGASAWENEDHYIYTYDGQNNPISEIDQSWDVGTSAWKNEDKVSANYTGGLRTSEVEQNWDNGNSQWINDEKTNYTYDGSGNNTGITIQEWNDSTNDWDNSEKMTFTYSGNLASQGIDQEWNDGVGQYVNFARIRYAYNSYSQCTQALTDFWNGSQWVNYISSNNNISQKVSFRYETYDDGTGIQKSLAAATFSLYPNPTAQTLHVEVGKGEMNHIRIANVSGQVVFETKAAFHASQVNLPVGNLPDGIYYLQLQSGTQQGTKAFVIKH